MVLVDGHLYGFDSSLLKCVDLVSAQEKWVTRELAKGSVLAAAGHLFVLALPLCHRFIATLTRIAYINYKSKPWLCLIQLPRLRILLPILNSWRLRWHSNSKTKLRQSIR